MIMISGYSALIKSVVIRAAGGHGKPRDQSESLSLNLDPLPSLATPLANASQKDRIAVRNRNRRPMTVAQRQSDEV
jgi:hypothetical protein